MSIHFMPKKFIYIFTNTHSPDVVKIGKTSRHPELEAEKLNAQAGVRGQFNVAWFKEVPDNAISLKIIHFCLREWNDEKEFFKIGKEEAIYIADKLTTEFFVSLRSIIRDRLEMLEKKLSGMDVAQKFASKEQKDDLERRKAALVLDIERFKKLDT